MNRNTTQMWLALGQDLSYPSELVSAGAELLQQLGQDRLGESTQVRVALPAGHPRTPAAAVNAGFQLWQPNRTSRLTPPVFFIPLSLRRAPSRASWRRPRTSPRARTRRSPASP